MPFVPKSAKKARKRSKRGPAKKDELSIKEKMELLYEKVLDDLFFQPRTFSLKPHKLLILCF